MDEMDSVYKIAREMIEDDRPRNNLFLNIDKIAHNEYELAGKDDTIREIVDTTGSDALASGATALSSLYPKPTVIPPMGYNDMEARRLNQMEACASYNFERADIRGDGSVNYDIALSSLQYGMTAVYTHDLCTGLPKDKSGNLQYDKFNKQQKRAWRNGRFLIRAYNPYGVHVRTSDLGIVGILHNENFRAEDVLAYWQLQINDTPEGQRINAACEELKEKMKNSPRLRVMQFSYLTDDDDVVWCRTTDSMINEDAVLQGNILFKKGKNELPFFPWSVRMGGSRLHSSSKWRVNPMLASLVTAGTWENVNLSDTMIYSELFKRLRSFRDVVKVNNPEEPLGNRIDFKNGNVLRLGTTEDYQRVQPYTIDPQSLDFAERLRAGMNRTTGASVLGDTNSVSSRTPFSTYAAMIQVAMGKMDVHRKIMSLTIGDIMRTFYEWADYTKQPLEAVQLKSGEGYGNQISLGYNDFDLDKLLIRVEIKSRTPVDEQQMLNSAIMMVEKLGMSKRQAWEDLGRSNPDMLLDEGVEEKLFDLEFQDYATMKQGETQLQLQMAGQQMAQQAQQQQQDQMQQQQLEMAQEAQDQHDGMNASNQANQTPQNMLSGLAFDNTQGQGFDTGNGGQSPATANPQMTRERINGNPMYQNRG